MSRAPRLVSRIVAVVLLFANGIAHADDAADRARRDFAEGVRLFQVGDFEGARALFLRADASRHAPAIMFNLARAEEKLGNVQAALDAYESYLLEAGTSGDLGLAASVATGELKERSARVRVESDPPGATIEIDGRIQHARTPAVVFVRPGTHRVRVSGTQIDETRLVDLRAPGEEARVVVRAEPAAPRDGGGSIYGGAGIALVPYCFIGKLPRLSVRDRVADRTNMTLGITIEGGVRVLPRLYLGIEGIAAVGTYGHPNYVVGGSVGLSVRLDSGFWLRAAAAVAAVDSNKDLRMISTDVVLGPGIDATYEIERTKLGTWMAGLGAVWLPADRSRDTAALFFPVRLGLRAM